MGSSDSDTIINTEQTPCSLHWSFEIPNSKMKISLIITLTMAALSHGSPLQSNLEISNSAQTTDHQRIRRSANGCPYVVKVEYSSEREFGFSASATVGASAFGFTASATAGSSSAKLPSSSEDPDSGPYKLLKKYYGTYTIQNGHIAGRDWYLSSNGRYAIWYKDGRWRVGPEGNKGTRSCVFYNTDDDKCPHQPGFNWEYYVSAINEWIDADYGMSIYDKTY